MQQTNTRNIFLKIFVPSLRTSLLLISIFLFPIFSCLCCLEAHAAVSVQDCCDQSESHSGENEESCCSDCLVQSAPRDLLIESSVSDKNILTKKITTEKLSTIPFAACSSDFSYASFSLSSYLNLSKSDSIVLLSIPRAPPYFI